MKKFLDGQLMPELESLNNKYKFEIVLVNDGSTDGTLMAIKGTEINRSENVKIISFVRNFGKEMALAAGIRHATGDVIIMIDADGQHPVEAIPKMLEKWENGARIVTTVRRRNKTKHKLGSALFYKVMRLLGNKNIVAGAMDFRLIDRTVADEYNRFTEHHRITRGLIDWLGYPQEYMLVDLKGRMYGSGTYDFRKLIALAGDSFISMSRTPLIIFGYVGVFIMVVSLLVGTFVLIEQYLMGDPMNLDWGAVAVMCVFISFLIGLVMVSQAVMASYIARVHIEKKSRPLYVIDKKETRGINV